MPNNLFQNFSDNQKYQSENIQLELEKLSNSFKQLKETTEQVSFEANATAIYLKEKLHDTTFRFFSVIDAVDDLILIKDSKLKWKTLNKFGQELYGLGPKEFFNKTDLELAEEYAHHSHGLTYCNFTELIETQQKEKACSDALNSASDNILILDTHGMITFCNHSFFNTFGLKQISDIKGLHFSTIISEKSNKIVNNEMWNCIKTNNSFQGILEFKHSNDYSFSGQINIIPIMNGHIEPIHYICVIKVCLV